MMFHLNTSISVSFPSHIIIAEIYLEIKKCEENCSKGYVISLEFRGRLTNQKMRYIFKYLEKNIFQKNMIFKS